MRIEPNLKQAPAANDADSSSAALDLSCLLDGELDGPERDRVLDRLLHDADAQRLWSAMHMVGDAIRSSEVACTHREVFRARLAASLAREAPIVAPRWSRERQQLFRRVVLPGAAVAAAAAMLIVVAVPLLRGGANDSAPAFAAASKSSPSAGSSSPAAAATVSVQRPINPYLQAHREFAPVGVLPPSAPYLRTSTTLPAENAR